MIGLKFLNVMKFHSFPPPIKLNSCILPCSLRRDFSLHSFTPLKLAPYLLYNHMDSTKSEKLQALRRCKMEQFLPRFIMCTLKAAVLGLVFLASPSWLPKLSSLLRFFFSVWLPSIGSIVIGSKCFFIVSNIIIIFLVGESKLSRRTESDMHEYIERSVKAGFQRMGNGRDKREERVMKETLGVEEEKDEEVVEILEEILEKIITKEEKVVKEEEMENKCEELNGEAADEEELDPEELYRRVEDFIAKVNMQRRLEAQMLTCDNSLSEEWEGRN